MDGCNLYVISGIDGKFSTFDEGIGALLKDVRMCKLAYDRSLTFVRNVADMRRMIDKDHCPCTIFGWSIGAVAACFLSDCQNVRTVISLNAFYKRSEALARRNIYCDEEVCVGDTRRQKTRYVLIRGAKDDKIPPSESERILRHYGLPKYCLFTFPGARHDIASFPTEEVTKLIRENL